MRRPILIDVGAGQLLSVCVSATGAAPSVESHWVATWASAQQLPAAGAEVVGAARQGRLPAATPVTPRRDSGSRRRHAGQPDGSHDRAKQHRWQPSARGVSNAFGTLPLDLGAATCHSRPGFGHRSWIGSHTAYQRKTRRQVLPGAVLLSDPVDLVVPKLGDPGHQRYVPGDSGRGVAALPSLAHNLYCGGRHPPRRRWRRPGPQRRRYWISSVDVMAPADAAAIVAFGDSITDGTTSTVNANKSWPSLSGRAV